MITFLNSFVQPFSLHLTEYTVRVRFNVNTVGAALFGYVKVKDLASYFLSYYLKRSASASDEASGIIYQSEY